MAEKIEIEILAKGKPAEKAIGRVDKKTEKLSKTTKKTGKDVDGVLTKMRAGWIAVGAGIAKAIATGKSFERLSLGLTEAQKEWAMQTALASDATAEQIAGFLKSAQTAGLAEEQMKALAEQAIALGYAFPHEDAETLHDNLVMLNTTGEAQGFIVDILEQKLSAMGIAFDDIDLKALSAAQKIALVGEVVKVSQDQMDDSKYKAVDFAISSLTNGFISLGNTLVDMLDNIGVLWVLNKAILGLNFAMKSTLWVVHSIKTAFDDSAEAQLKFEDSITDMQKAWAQFVGMDFTAEVNNLNDSLLEVELNLGKTVVTTDELSKSMEKTSSSLKDAGSSIKDTAKSVEDAFVNMAMGSKNAFKDLMRSIVAEFIRANIRKNIIEPLSKIGIFEFLTPKMTPIPTQHTGGFIPSYHSGFRGDERLAKLQVGEAVINRHGASRNKQAIDAMNAGMSVGGGGSQVINVTYSPQVNALDPSTAASVIAQNAPTVVGVVRQAFNRNGQSVRL